ncbi:alpha/beta hydrolase-fold protein [candidate division KSB1 bacterium]
MKKQNYILILFCITLLLANLAFSQTVEITFRIFPPENTPADAEIFITGNLTNLGRWDPAGTVLAKKESGYYEITLPFEKDTRIEYKITRGSWSNEAVSAEGVVPANSRLTAEQSEIIIIHIAGWKDFFHTTPGGVTGTVKYHPEFRSEKLENTRDVAVLLPKSYESSSNRYPVMYMHDGQNCFDPGTSYIGVDWQVDEAVDTLAAKGVIEEIIIVAVSNTSARMREYSDTPEGHAYMDFLINELKPFVDKTYRTKPDRQNTAVMGSSMGGLISFLCTWYHPDVFGKAACLSTSMSARSEEFFELAEKFDDSKKALKIYFDTGDEAQRESYSSAYERLEEILLGYGFEKGKDIEFLIFEGHDHSERSWASRIHHPLIFLFGKNR